MNTCNLEVRQFVTCIHILHGRQSLDVKRPVSNQHASYNWRTDLGLPCWNVILHVQDIASRWSRARLSNASMYTGDGEVLCVGGSSGESY